VTTRPKHLRLAKSDNREQNRKTVAEAAESGDHRALLVAMRERIAKTVSDPDCPPRDLAALTRRLQEIAREIQQLDARTSEVRVYAGDPDSETWDEAAI